MKTACTKINAAPNISFDTKFDESYISNETEDLEKQVQWSELPSLPLEDIYSYVSREDQLNMSLVCRKWSEGFGTPSVWKTFRFAFSESQLSMVTCPVMKIVWKYSRMFRHVKIPHLKTRNQDLIYKWCRYLIEFLQILKGNSHIISLEFRDSLYHFKDTPIYWDICEAIGDFIGSQCFLKRVEFIEFFKCQNGTKLLKKLVDNNREHLKHLTFRRFVHCKSMNCEYTSTFVESLSVLLCHLTTIEIEYSLVFEKAIKNLCYDIKTLTTCRLTKIILIIQYPREGAENLQGLTSNDWRQLKMLCPNLHIDLSLSSDGGRELEFVIVPNMPISELRFVFNTYEGIEGGDGLFNHLHACKTNDNLVALHLVSKWQIGEHLPSTFIPFLQACKKLKSLKLITSCETEDIELFLESLMRNRPESLEKVFINFLCVPDDDYVSFLDLKTEYVFFFKSAGLNLAVYVNE